MEALKLRLTRAVSGDSNSTGVSSVKARGRRSALSAFQFRRANLAKSLLAAAERGNAGRVRELLDGPAGFDDVGDTAAAVRAACERGHLDVLATLIRYGATVNGLGGDGGGSALHIAVRHGYVSLMTLLIGNGANVSLATKFDRRSPLHVAALKGRVESARVLLESDSRIDPDVADIYGTTPLHLATAMGHAPLVGFLLGWRRRPDVNAYDNDGWTALHLAAERGDAVVVELLLGHHAQVDSQNKYGRTPLHWATIRRHVDVVELLLQNDASPTLRDLHDKDAFDYADDVRIERLLRARPVPADPDRGRSTIGGLMRISARKSFIGRLAEPIPEDGSWARSIRKERSRMPKLAAADELDAIVEENGGRRSSGSSDACVDDSTAAGRASHFRSLFARAKSASGSCDSDADTQSTSTILPAGLFDREPSTDSESGVAADDPTSTPRSPTPDGAAADTAAAAAAAARAQFEALMAKVERHQAAIEGVVAAAAAEAERASVRSKADDSVGLRTIAAMMTKVNDLVFAFREDVGHQARLVRQTTEAFFASAESRLALRDPLPVPLYHGFFHAVVSYLAERPHGPRLVVQKMAGISEEARSDLLQVLSGRGLSKTARCTQAVYFALDNVQAPYKQTPLLALIALVKKCDFEEDATRTILEQFLKIVHPNIYGCLEQNGLFTLSNRLGSDGGALAVQLGVLRSNENGAASRSADRANLKPFFEHNLEVLSRWRQKTAHCDSECCLLQLVEGLILIGREDLLVWVLSNHRPASKGEESDC